MLVVSALALMGAMHLDVQAYHFRIVLPDTGTVIHAAARIEFTSRTDTLALDLVGMTVDSVSGGTFTHDGTKLRIVTTARTVTVYYHGSPRDGLIIRNNARGRRSYFGDNWPNRARFWLPTVDHPSDKARVTWDVVAPAGMEVVTTRTGDRAIPTYCMVIGVTEMTVSRRGRTEIWAYPEDSAFADSVPFRRAPEILDVMERLVGPYSYERLAHVQSSTRYGGMENSSAIFYNENGYVQRRTGEGVVRHEVAHQWFGDAVTQRDWHHVWLSEGFATYFNAVIAQQLDGDSAYWAVMHGARASYLRSQATGRPIIDTTITDPNRLLDANAYQKGGWVLHMLRGLVGDSAFFRGVRAYYARYRDTTALSADFQREMERAAGQDLGWFFRQWLWQPAWPQLEVTWRWERGAVLLTVRQAQPALFRIPAVPIELVGVGSRTIALDGRQARQTFRLPAAREPDSVRVDPGATLLLTAEVRR
jgi:aminopeptidase N